MEQLEKQDKTVRKLKKQLKVFAKKIGELEGTFVLSDKDFGILCDLNVIISICFSSCEVFSSFSLCLLQEQDICSDLCVFLYEPLDDLLRRWEKEIGVSLKAESIQT